MLDTFEYYNKTRDEAGVEADISMALPKKDFNSEVLEIFAEGLGKLLKDTPVLKEKDRTNYLMPDATGEDWNSVLTSTRYNLR